MVISRQVFHTNTHSHTLTLTSSSPQRSRKNKTKAQRSALRDEINGETFFPRHANIRPIDERVPPQEHSRRLRLTHCSSETCHRGFATETGKLMKNLIQWTTHTHRDMGSHTLGERCTFVWRFERFTGHTGGANGRTVEGHKTDIHKQWRS